MMGESPHKAGAGCQNKKKGNYGFHHSCRWCYPLQTQGYFDSTVHPRIEIRI